MQMSRKNILTMMRIWIVEYVIYFKDQFVDRFYFGSVNHTLELFIVNKAKSLKEKFESEVT